MVVVMRRGGRGIVAKITHKASQKRKDHKKRLLCGGNLPDV
jgi:hypothetical protein